MDCSPTDLKCLRNVPVSEILRAQRGSALEFAPKANTAVLPHNLIAAFRRGYYHKNVPVVLGTNADEERLFTAIAYGTTGMTDAQYKALVKPAVYQEYPPEDYGGSAAIAYSAVGTDRTYACIARRMREAMTTHGTRLYAYEFSDKNAPPPGNFPKLKFDLGAAHSTELPYLFDYSRRLKAAGNQLTPAQEQLSATMVTYWVQFAKTGNPNPSSDSAPFWPFYNLSNHKVLSLERPKSEVITNFARKHHCNFWDQRQAP